ncbi:TPR-like protein [Myriangium duriaei CBS 260.36]|uniref:TPR-like protein n=1 Tax=Myriangium duriaei CBS 260.36 TaxID=1168546 RepID=A0A9P4IQ11_9PEZI|nr:TPR-like protein [Myriangium duriaei CBS 260.36]
MIMTNGSAAYSGGNTPSVHCLIPFPENLNFTGREVVLADIKRKLFVERDCRSLAIVGLGGVGKTQVALRMAYWTQQNQPDYSIFWIPALSPETIVQQCAEIVAELRLTKIQPNEDSRMTLRRYLSSSQSGQWLLIVDNVDDVDILDVGYTSNFKFSNRNGVTLFTTRHTEAAVSLSGKHVVELQRLTQEEGLTLLGSTLIRAESSGRQDCEYEIDLLEELDFHPLAITQAVAYINTKHILVPEYLGLLKNTEQSLVKTMSREFRDDTRYPASKNAVATTWLVSFEQIRVMDPLAADIMCFFSQVGSKAVPRPMLPKGNSEGEDADAGEETTSAMGTLMSFAFITRRSTRHLYDMHRLVHLATRIWIQKDQRTSEVNHKAVRHLSENFPNSHYKNRKTWQEWLPHAIRLVEDCKETGLEEKYSLCRRIGLCLYEDGRYEECLHFILEHYKWNRIHLEENTPIFLEFQHYLAKVYIENSQTAQAIDMLEQVVAVRKRTTIEDDTALLDSQHELARAYRHRGEFSKAINLMEHVVLVRQKSLPEVDPDLLASQHVLALLEYYHADRAPEGMRLMEHIVAIEERTLQKDDPNRLLTQHELACMYFDIDRPDCAKKLLESVVANYAQTLDEEHPHRLVSEDLLARVCLETQDIPKATLLAEHVVRVRERTLSVTDPKLSKSQYGLARAYLKGGHLTRAVEQLRHVVKVRSAICEDDTLLLLCQQQLASIYLTERKVGTAIQLLQHVVKMRAKMLSEDNASRLVSEYNLAHAYLLGGNARDAIPLLQHVVAIEATRLDEDDRSRLVSQKRLADPYFAGGMLCEAIALADHVYTVRMRKLGKDHEDVDDSQLQLQQFRETANTVAKESVDGARGEMNS